MAAKERKPKPQNATSPSENAKVAEVTTTGYAIQLETRELNKTDLATVLRTLTAGLQRRLGSQVQLVMLYGSHARGEARPESDVDLFVVLRRGSAADYDKVRQVAYQVMWDANFSYVFSLYLTDVQHYEALEEHGSSFLRNVQREGKVLWRAT